MKSALGSAARSKQNGDTMTADPAVKHWCADKALATCCHTCQTPAVMNRVDIVAILVVRRARDVAQTTDDSLTVCDIQGVQRQLRVLFKADRHMIASEVGLRSATLVMNWFIQIAALV